MTGKKAGIVLILNKKSDKRHLEKTENINDKYNLNIQVWTVEDYNNGITDIEK